MEWMLRSRVAIRFVFSGRERQQVCEMADLVGELRKIQHWIASLNHDQIRR